MLHLEEIDSRAAGNLYYRTNSGWNVAFQILVMFDGAQPPEVLRYVPDTGLT